MLLFVLFALLVVRTFMYRWRSHYERSDSPDSSPLVSAFASSKTVPEPVDLDLKAPYLDEKASTELVETPKVAPRRPSPRRITGAKDRSSTQRTISTTNASDFSVQVLLFYSSLTGTTQEAAKSCLGNLRAWRSTSSENARLLEPEIYNLSNIDYDEFFINPPNSKPDEVNIKYFYLILTPSYDIDTLLATFLAHLEETHHDFRIDSAPLSPLLGYSVFGFGDGEGWPTEAEGFCVQAKEIDKWMAKLTDRKRAFPLGMGDVQTDASDRLQEWRAGVESAIQDIIANGGLGEGVSGSGDAVESEEEEMDEFGKETDNQQQTNSKTKVSAKSAAVDDLEDLGRTLKPNAPETSSSTQSLLVDFTTFGKSPAPSNKPTPEMVPKSSPTYAALTKQGYTIVGSHSGVKICRWTKSALRGRGSCYKYSFYGIKSHLCMESTPSLSCSNKCVFCWRHGTNPVGTTWRWQVDRPELIFAGVKEGHYKKIRMLKGVPGVRAERFAEAFRIRHCALSLVGEPIFYPHINELTALLHAERISTFLVCNAQHPMQLAALAPVTQLYVSIDASNRESLRRIDRPLHRDFWERFMACLDILRERRFRQRTVFRLTLVKGFNVDEEVEGYADLVARALPAFVEVKGVTYCGTSASSSAGLTMQNVPFYDEVAAFVTALDRALARRDLSYGIAAEHAHSCCVLLADTRFRLDGRWHTHIDYVKFFELLESGEGFAPEDYIGPPTPEWATWGKGGFDPADQRVYRKGKNKGKVAEVTVRDGEAEA